MTCVVTSNEPDDGQGDGQFTGDVNGADGFAAPVPVTMSFNLETGYWKASLELRSERNGAADGRKYALICRASDHQRNATTATACIVVPHDKRKK